MSKQLTLRVCPEEARELIMDWLVPLTENGTMDELMHAFVTELTPYAQAAAEKAIRRRMMPQAPEIFAPRLADFLRGHLATLEAIVLNPDMMAVAMQTGPHIAQAIVDLRDWIYFLDHCGETELPSADAVKKGGAA